MLHDLRSAAEETPLPRPLHDTVVVRSVVITLLIAVASACSAQDAIETLLQEATQAAQRGEHERAIERLNETIAKSPETAIAWYLRGREHFRAGKIKESVADFDKYVTLKPDAERSQWERGISLYYAGDYVRGAKQFELYQTYHDQDVENSAWRYLCVARSEGVEKAQANMLPIEHDPRVPMMAIYDLYRGKLKPEDVLAAANAGDPDKETLNVRLFYAHLYIGLWHEVAGRADEAREHIQKAEQHKIGHYMWDVAHVHSERLK
jgi:lipoprotein NlpI